MGIFLSSTSQVNDTTAISTAYAGLLLVANPQVQGLVYKKLQYHVKDGDLKTFSYKEVLSSLSGVFLRC